MLIKLRGNANITKIIALLDAHLKGDNPLTECAKMRKFFMYRRKSGQ